MFILGTQGNWRLKKKKKREKETGNSFGLLSCPLRFSKLQPNNPEKTYQVIYKLLTCIPEEAMAPHSSTLAWKIPWTEEPGRLRFTRTRLSNFTFTFHFDALEKEMATHSSVLAWRIPGTGEPDALPSTGSHTVRHD